MKALSDILPKLRFVDHRHNTVSNAEMNVDEIIQEILRRKIKGRKAFLTSMRVGLLILENYV